MDRREFLILGGMAAGSKLMGACPPDRLATPYKLERLVLSASGEAGAFDKVSVDGPFVFRTRDGFRMTFLGFDGNGYQTGMARSDDLVRWEKMGPILQRDPNSAITRHSVSLHWILRENEVYSPGNLTPVDGEYLGAYQAYPDAGYEQGAGVIGLARSRDLEHWRLEPPVLDPQDGAAWERGGLYKPCLARVRGTYYLFYNAKNQTEGPWHEQTGVAMSTDLRHWTRFAGNPVIQNGGRGSLDERFASDPCVLRDEGRWVLFYFGLDGKGVARDLAATATDLNHVRKCCGALIDVGQPGTIDSEYAHKPSVIAHQGDLYHFYCAVSRVNGKEVRGISVARSRPWNG